MLGWVHGGENVSIPDAQDAVDFFDMVGQTNWNRALQRTLVHWIGLRDSDAVLDAGCGAGRFTVQFAPRCVAVTGLDVSEAMVRRSSLNAMDLGMNNVSFVVGNITSMPFAENRFDVVFCSDLLFMFDDIAAPLAELLRVCKSGGRLVIMDPSDRMNPWAVKNYCETHGLEDFERDSLLSWATAAAKRRLKSDAEIMSLVGERGGTLVESLQMMEGLVSVFSFRPEPWIKQTNNS